MRSILVFVVAVLAGVPLGATAGEEAGKPLKVCILSGCLTYNSEESLPPFQDYLERNYNVRCTRVMRKATDDLPGLEQLDDCDVVLVFIKRMQLKGEQLEQFKKYATSGRPIVAVRTASHAVQTWLDFDREVLGGNYHGHYPVGPGTKIEVLAEARQHPILAGVELTTVKDALYKNEGHAKDIQVLLKGRIPDQPAEALAWTRTYKKGRIFYTSLGAQDTFQQPGFRRMLANALFWAASRDVEAKKPAAGEGKLPPAAAGPVDFSRDIQPIFAERCYECHSAKKQRGGLRLDRKADALAGGDSGAVFQPGKSAESLLLRYVAGLEPNAVMPPKGDRLTAKQIGLLHAWIDQGMTWPDQADSLSSARSAQEHWSFQPLQQPALPAVTQVSWVRNPIDRFILAKLETLGIRPSPEAERATLIRRLYLDLLGLPPTPAAIDAFVNDPRPQAYDSLVEQLLASPHFGERWGRHWLDLARYADSNGYENDKPRPHAWRFRDWVIQAVNQDMPFDQFTIEQLAGDLLPEAAIQQKTATGFHRMTLSNGTSGNDREEFRVKAVKDRVNTTGTVWLGLTLGCCQCHSHKYDPITQREYYELFAFFNNCDDANIPLGPSPLPIAPGEKGKGKGGQNEEALTLRSATRESHVHVRGDFLSPGTKVEPGTPGFLPPLQRRGAPPDRLDLARWLVSAENPLTARVAVNHFWHHLFGQPLVPTVDNFGLKGERPSHPELLDWLATEFRARGWSRKEVIKLIVTSATYRQASRNRPELAERDPGNTLLARQNRFRVEGEVVRDLALVVSGLLNPRFGGPSMQPPLPSGIFLPELMREAFVRPTAGLDRYRRGLYIHVQRTLPYPMLQAFDAPDGNESCGRRDRSTTPIQALTTLNDPVFAECAQALGRRLLHREGDASAGRLFHAWLLCLGRSPTDQERAAVESLLARHREFYTTDVPLAQEMVGPAPLPPEVAVAEAATWVGVARVLLNLEEFSTRE